MDFLKVQRESCVSYVSRVAFYVSLNSSKARLVVDSNVYVVADEVRDECHGIVEVVRSEERQGRSAIVLDRGMVQQHEGRKLEYTTQLRVQGRQGLLGKILFIEWNDRVFRNFEFFVTFALNVQTVLGHSQVLFDEHESPNTGRYGVER
jgi:hypothetical protein